jgi:hypothetical protein
MHTGCSGWRTACSPNFARGNPQALEIHASDVTATGFKNKWKGAEGSKGNFCFRCGKD